MWVPGAPLQLLSPPFLKCENLSLKARGWKFLWRFFFPSFFAPPQKNATDYRIRAATGVVVLHSDIMKQVKQLQARQNIAANHANSARLHFEVTSNRPPWYAFIVDIYSSSWFNEISTQDTLVECNIGNSDAVALLIECICHMIKLRVTVNILRKKSTPPAAGSPMNRNTYSKMPGIRGLSQTMLRVKLRCSKCEAQHQYQEILWKK